MPSCNTLTQEMTENRKNRRPDPFRFLFIIILGVVLGTCSQHASPKATLEIKEHEGGWSSFVGEILQFQLDDAENYEFDCIKQAGVPLVDQSGLVRKRGSLDASESIELRGLLSQVSKLSEEQYELSNKLFSDAWAYTIITVIDPTGRQKKIQLMGSAGQFSKPDEKLPPELARFMSYIFEIKGRVCTKVQEVQQQ